MASARSRLKAKGQAVQDERKRRTESKGKDTTQPASVVNTAKRAGQTAKKAAETKQQSEQTRNRRSTDTRANSGKTSATTTTAPTTSTANKQDKTTPGGIQALKEAARIKADHFIPAMSQHLDQEIERTRQQNELLRLNRRTQALKDYDRHLEEMYGVKTPWPSFMSRPATRDLTDDEKAEIARLEQNIEALRVPMINGGTSYTNGAKMWGVSGPSTWEQVGPGGVQWHNEQVSELQRQIDEIKARANGSGVTARDYTLRGKTPLDVLKADGWTKLWTGKTFPEIAQELRDTRPESEQNRETVQNTVDILSQFARQGSARKQTLSPYDSKLGQGARDSLKLAKADYDAANQRYQAAKARGDKAAMNQAEKERRQAHQRAEEIRRIQGGYSGGKAGNEYITPDLSEEDKANLTKEGQALIRAAKLGYANSWNDTDRARFADQAAAVRQDPAYQKDRFDRGAYRNIDANGRMVYSGTPEEREQEAKQLGAILPAIGMGVAGSFASIPEVTRRALQTDAARNNPLLRAISDARGGGEVNISEPAPITGETKGQELLRRAQEYRKQATEGQKGMEKYLTEALITGGEMIPGLAATALTGGATLPGLAVMGAQAAGREMGTLNAKGTDPVKAFNRGLVSGGIEAGTELLPLRNLTRIAKGSGDNFARNLLTQALEEVGTEEASEIGQYLADKAFKDPDASLTAQDLKDTAVISLLTSLGMGAGAGMIGGRRAGSTQEQSEQDSRTITALDQLTPTMEELSEQEQALQGQIKQWKAHAVNLVERLKVSAGNPQWHKHLLAEMQEHQAQGEQFRVQMIGIEMQKARRQQVDEAKAAQEQRAEQARQAERYRQTMEQAQIEAAAMLQARRAESQAMPEARVSAPMPLQVTDAEQRPAQAIAQPQNMPLQGTESTVVDTDPTQHTTAEQAVIDAYQASTDEALKEVFADFLADPNQKFSRHNISSVTERQAKDAASLVGGKYTGYQNAINTNGVRHIMNRHGPTGEADHSLGDLNDAARIAYILDNYDSVDVARNPDGTLDYSAEFKTADNTPAPKLIYKKKVNGTYYVVEAVPESKYKKFWVISAYMQNNNGSTSPDQGMDTPVTTADGGTQVPNARNPETTSETSFLLRPSADTSIPQGGAEINRKSVEEPYSVGAAPSGFDKLSDWQLGTDQFHSINQQAMDAAAENWGRAPVDIPVRDPYGQMTSKTASTLINAGMTPNQISDVFTDMVRKGQLSRIPYTDNEAVHEAERIIQENGFQKAKGDWLSKVRAGKMSKDLTTMGIVLYNNAANAGSIVEAIDIATDFIEYGKTAGQVLQAVNIINKLGPAGQLYSLASAMDRLENEIRKRQKKDGTHWDGITIDKDLAKEYIEAQSEEERRAIEKKIKKNIASQIPSTLQDKLDAWRYTAMLGNPLTQERNIAGNLGFQPVRIIKNAVGTALEHAAGLDQFQRTKSLQFKALSKADKARYQAGLDEYDQVESVIMGNGKYNDTFSEIDQYRRIFKNRFLEGWRKLTNAGLEAGDVFFAKRTYADSLAGVLKARGITAEQYNDPSFSRKQKEEIQAIAIVEAQKATYRDINKFSSWVSGLGKGPNTPKAVHYLTEGLLPFKKTPANVLMRGIEYSPIGLIKGIADMNTKVKRGEMTAAEGLDEIASGLTGTGLLGLGVALGLSGIVSAGADDDEKQAKFDELLGKQNYALNLPGGYSFTLDWMAPEAIPFFMGVELQKAWQDVQAGEKGKDALWNALRRITDPVLEMSMLQGVNNLIENVSYSDNKAMSILATLATGYLSQFIPTIGGQIERTMEDRRYSTWIDRDSAVPSEIQYLIGKNLNKIPIPGVEYHQREYLNAWGEPEMTGNPLTRALQNFASPGYIKKQSGGAVEDELQRLYKAGYNVFPTIEPTSTQIQGENDKSPQYLTAEQFNLMQKTKGQMMKDFYTQTIQSKEYQELSDADKAAVLDQEAQYARDMGQVAAGKPVETLAAWVKNTESLSQSTGIGVAALIEASGIAQAINARENENPLLKALNFYDYMDKKGYSEEQQDAIQDAYFESNAETRGYAGVVRSGAVSRETMEKFIETGKEFDTNDNGLDQTETIQTLKSMGLPHDEAKAIFEATGKKDDNGNVKTTYEEKLKDVEKQEEKQAIREKYLTGMDQDKIDAFDAAAADHGTGSYRGIYDTCMAVQDATMAERNQYYNSVRYQMEKPWKCNNLAEVEAWLKKNNK